MSSSSKITVVIATRNRADFLNRCLIGLMTQTLPPEMYDICVVNNAGSDATPELVARLVSENPQFAIKLVDEPKMGLSRARNTGVAATTAPFIAFIDDDGIPSPDCLEKYVTYFDTLPDSTAVIGGEVIPIWPTTRPEWISDAMLTPLSARTKLGAEARFIGVNEDLFECNSCYRRTALEQAGGFPTYLGRSGNNLLSGDGMVNVMISRNGGKIYFDPAITMHHAMHADRLTPGWFRKRFFWQGVTTYAMQLYFQRLNLPPMGPLNLTLPLSVSDWYFINQDTTENIEDSMMKFQSLGYALAISGLLPVETSQH